ncbi:MAG: cation:proton antiporter [Myxococcales bacterium]|nr:cation:proton antiporter [Myxococcales bacterium]
MAAGEHLLQSLLVLLAVAVLGPMVAVRLRMPTAVVLIVAGIGLGPAGLSLLRDTPTVGFLSHFGFLVLMFMAGMEIDFASIRSAGPRSLIRPSLVIAGVGICTALSARLLHLGPVHALVVSAIAVGLPLATLKEAGHAGRKLGRHIMLTASIGEFAVILAVTGVELAHDGGLTLHTAGRIAKIAALFFLCAFVIRVARALVWWFPERFRRLIEHHDVAELGVRVGLFIMLAFVAISALAGVEPILGAFLGGMLVGFVLRQKEVLEGKIAALGNGLFIPIFFIVVGVRFDASALDRAVVHNALLLAGTAGLCKAIPALLIAPVGFSLRERLATGCLLSAPLTLVVAIAAIGRSLKMITASTQASLVLVGILLSLCFPVLFKLIAPPAALDASDETAAH